MNKRQSGQLVNTSNFIENNLSSYEKEIITDLSTRSGLTEKEIIIFLKTDDGWEKLMNMKKKSLDLDMIELIKDFKISVKEKISRGSLEQAKSGMVGISIALDKLYGKADGKRSSLKIEGTNVQVNMPFKFQPYNTKKTEIEQK